MRRVLLFFAFLSFSLSAQELPKPTGVVSDFAEILSAGEERQLTRELKEVEGAQMLIYIAPSLPSGAVLEDLTLRSANAWGIGRKGVDDGLAVFVFMRERKVRIEIGRGLESKISDAQAKAVIDEQITPAFRERQFAKGLSAAIAKLRSLLQRR